MSANDTPMNDDLLVKYLVGEASPDESIRVEEWINAGDNNRRYFDQLNTIWEQSEAVTTGGIADEGTAWQELQGKLNVVARDVNVTPVNKAPLTAPVPVADDLVIPIRKKRSKFRGLVIASVIILLVAAGYFAYNYFGTAARQVKLYSGNIVLLDTLPDGSIVTLNNLTRITYPDKFKGSKRELTLQGEAYFKVEHNAIKPFIVTADGVTVKVTGTVFNMKSRNGKTEISVDEGTVNVTKGGNSTDVHAGEKLEVNKASDRFVKETMKSKLYGYYATGELVCVQTPLNELVETLKEIYDADIAVQNPAIENMPITTTFKNKTVDQILLAIAENYNVTIDYQGTQIILK